MSSSGLLADVIPFSWVDGPGNRFVAFLQGCTFDCIACHNPRTIPVCSRAARRVTDADLVAEIAAVAPFLSGVTMSGGECTMQWPFVRDVFGLVKAELPRLTTLVDTNGDADDAVWDALAPVMDGAMVDLKALDGDLHAHLAGAGNERVLASIRHLAAIDRLSEVRLLLVPEVNDDVDTLHRTVAWLLDVAPEVPVRVQCFRRHGVRREGHGWREATADERAGYADVLREAGLGDFTVV